MKNKFLATAIILSISHISAMEQPTRIHENLPTDTQNEILAHILTHTGFTSVEQLVLWKETLRKPLIINFNQRSTDYLLKILEKAKEWNINMALKLLNYGNHLTQIANDPNASQIVALDLSREVLDSDPRSALFPALLQEIMKMTNLEVLNLSGNTIHWSTSNYLHMNMPEGRFLKLKELNLSNTNLNSESIQHLKEAFAKIGNHHINIII